MRPGPLSLTRVGVMMAVDACEGVMLATEP